MPAALIQPSFTGGELAPSLHARIDLAKYAVGLKTCRNFLIHAHGGASNRPGTEFVGPARDPGGVCRLIPFAFNTEQTYALEFGDAYLRVIKAGGHVLETAKTISGAAANPVTVTAVAHGFANGDHVYIDGVAGMTALNGRFFKVSGASADAFALHDFDGNAIDGTAYAAYVSGGTAARLYTLATPYAAADLALLKLTQSADTLYLVHPGYAPRKLTRTAHDNWALGAITFAPSIAAPTGVTVTPLNAGASTYSYRVTAVKQESFEESLPGGGSTAAAAVLSATNTITVSWNTVSGAQKYNLYRQKNGLYGFVGATEATSFVDDDIAPALDDSPPAARNPFDAAGKYPGTITLHEQRAVYAQSSTKPDTIWMSQSANYENMNVSTPAKDDDAVTFTIAARQVNEIRHLVPLNDLVVLTSGGEWRVDSGDADALAPSAVRVKPQSYYGAAHVPPLVVGNTVLFVQEKGTIVRDLGYQLEVDGYTGNDLSVLANHLFEGRRIVEWAFAQVPHSVVWAVRDDGVLLGLTYMREHQVWAWHRHDTDGAFESVCALSEGSEDAVYVVVRRRIGGVIRRTIERLRSRHFADVRDAFFVDCGLSYDAPIAVSATTQAAPVVITAPAHGFANGDLVDIVGVEGMTELNGRRFAVDAATTNTFALLDPTSGAAIDGTAFGAYVAGGVARRAVSSVGGLHHLEGKTVAILADGNVEPPQAVAAGAVTLTGPASRVHVGLPYTCDLETLNVEFPSEAGSVQGRRKRIGAVTVRVDRSRGLWAGPDAEHLTELKQRSAEPYGAPTALASGDLRIVPQPAWSTGGRLFLRQKDPLPLTVLALIPEVGLGG